MKTSIPTFLLAFALTACATTTPDRLASAPWDAHASIEAAPVVVDQWRAAENRAGCAPLTIADAGARVAGATPRRAAFSGGWGVAWDASGLPGRSASGQPCDTCGRGVFGVAGAGVLWGAGEPSDALPYRKEWQGGNVAAYGPEGGTGPAWLAQVRVADQTCVYNVWTFLGREHLEHLLEQLRRVRL